MRKRVLKGSKVIVTTTTTTTATRSGAKEKKMKKLILVSVTLLLATNLVTASAAACKLNLKVKKIGAKTAYLKDQTISNSMQKKLIAGGCSISKVIMSENEVRELKIQTLRNKLKKLQGSK